MSDPPRRAKMSPPGAAVAGSSGGNLRKNSVVRTHTARAERRVAKKAKTQARRKRQRDEEAAVSRGEEPAPRKVPRTIESERVYDDDTGRPLTVEDAAAIDDEFSKVLAGEVRPNVMVTTGPKATPTTFDFIEELLPVVTDCVFYERRGRTIKEVLEHALEGGFTDVLVVKEDKKKVSSLIHAHLPEGPTAVYKVSSFVPSKRIRNHGHVTRHTPEVLLNNFTTDLGVRVGRMLGSLFPHTPNFVGRQAATFHNQRDFIFFRFHRYVFNANKDRARLQELGPRFTLKLQGLQKGTFKDPQKAEHEWKNSTKKDVERRKFFL